MTDSKTVREKGLRKFAAVKNTVGKFYVEDAFRITGRGWVLAGLISENASPALGNKLAFDSGVSLHISAFEMIYKKPAELVGLLISDQFGSRQELFDQHIIGSTAWIIQ